MRIIRFSRQTGRSRSGKHSGFRTFPDYLNNPAGRSLTLSDVDREKIVENCNNTPNRYSGDERSNGEKTFFNFKKEELINFLFLLKR